MHVRNLRLTLVNGCLVLGIAGHGVCAGDAMAWDGETYVLSVGDMEILHDINTDDRWSAAPDLIVRIERRILRSAATLGGSEGQMTVGKRDNER